MLTRTDPARIAPRNSVPTRPTVSGFDGAAMTTTSARGSASGRPSGVTISATGSSPDGRRRTPTTAAPNAAARTATAVPIAPSPTISHVVPITSRNWWGCQA